MKTIKELSTKSNKILEARVAGTGRDNEPNCATVKPFSGWHIAGRAVKQIGTQKVVFCIWTDRRGEQWTVSLGLAIAGSSDERK